MLRLLCRSGKDLGNGNRCFNCGSYVHALKDCPKPRDTAAITAARAELAAKKAAEGAADCAPKRYHGLSLSEKKQKQFEGLQPGVLCAELREALGMGVSSSLVHCFPW